MACSADIYYPRGFIHHGDPQLQRNTAMTLPCLLQSKRAHLALRRTQGKQKWEGSSLGFLCVDVGL